MPIIWLVGCSQGTTSERSLETDVDNKEIIMDEEQIEVNGEDAGKDDVEKEGWSNVSKSNSDDREIEGATDNKANPATSAPRKLIEVDNKMTYIKKLKDVEVGLASLEEKSKNGTQLEMTEAANEIYKTWDNALNEVYSALATQLSAKEMEVVKAEQREWIILRDDAAEKAASEFAGGTLEPYVHAVKLAELTMKRSFELVERYMK